MSSNDPTAWMGENWPYVLGSLITVIGTAIFGPKGWNALLEKLKNQTSEEVGAPVPAPAPAPLPPTQQQEPPSPPFQNVCLILGQGGTGKTTLISRITNDEGAMPELETVLFRLYEHRVTINQRECKITLSDYRGQDLGVLTGGILELEKSTTVRRKNIGSLLLILDICDTDSGLPRVPNSLLPDYEHLEGQVAQWTGQSLNAVLGLLTGSRLRFVLVLVNKIDLLTTGESNLHLPQIDSMLNPLREKLRRALPHVPIEVLLGSAKGAAAIDIRNKLAFHAAVQD